MRRYLPVALIINLLLAGVGVCQDSGNKTLISVNGHNISMAEFEWTYLKNNSGSGKSTVDEYLDLYINFRLKVEAASEAGLDKTASFERELDGYRKQLARNYLTDQEAKEELIKKAYERYREEINVYHVLVKCAPDASPVDTADAYWKAMKIRERIRLGEPFESVARGASDDQSASVNGGNLGYITVFQTPMAFENAVYSMIPGALSKPIRTSGGYHIIKVQNRRKSQGRIRVAHIMKAVPPGSTNLQQEEARHTIDSLYRLVVSGNDFSLLAEQNSDDLASSNKGGELPWFGCGEMIMNFSEAAFSLLHDGDISTPVRTIYGWHLIKRLEKQPLPPFEEARITLEGKLNQSYLISLSRKSFTEKLKKEYNFRVNMETLEWFYSISDSSFISGNYNIPGLKVPSTTLYSFAAEKTNAAQFMNFIRQKGSQAAASDSIGFINSLFEIKSYEDLVKYEDSVLEIKYPEFRYLVNEFHDGILLFEISDSLVWKRALSDTAGLILYYETRKEEFIVKPEASAVIYAIDKRAGKKSVKKIIRTIKKYSDEPGGMKKIYSSAKSGRDTLVVISEGSWRKGENQITDAVKWTEGYHQYTDISKTYLIDIKSVSQQGYLDYDSVREQLVNDYMKQLEQDWIKQLRSDYSVVVDDDQVKILNEKLKDK
ncbi:MAG: hypothetical protein E4G95_01590 [Bacteroidia bacterium]|nr:MAG: hypothetical protein E4G95_01590 [Bacteroidia bacterium]